MSVQTVPMNGRVYRYAEGGRVDEMRVVLGNGRGGSIEIKIHRLQGGAGAHCNLDRNRVQTLVRNQF
jgi:hypothetical protein